MEGTSVLDQNKPAAAAAPAAPAQPASVLDQPQPAPAPAAPTGEQSVLGAAPAGPKKPITFYKKAWFWILIAVFVLGIAGLIVFLVIQANITEEAIKNYNKNANEAQSAAYDFDSKFSSIFGESGFDSYSTKDSRYTGFRDKCLETLGTNREQYQAAKEITFFNGEKAVDELGTGKVRELSESYAKVVESLGDISSKIKPCEEMLAKEFKSSYSVTVGEFTADKSGWDYGLSLTVKNKNSKYSVRYRIEMKAEGADGKSLGTDTVYTQFIEPGKSAEADIFDAGFYSKVDQLKEATFTITSVKEYDVKE